MQSSEGTGKRTGILVNSLMTDSCCLLRMQEVVRAMEASWEADMVMEEGLGQCGGAPG